MTDLVITEVHKVESIDDGRVDHVSPSSSVNDTKGKSIFFAALVDGLWFEVKNYATSTEKQDLL